MAVPLDQLPPRERAARVCAQKLSDAEYEHLANDRRLPTLRNALAEALERVYGRDAAAEHGGLRNWLAFILATETLDRNLRQHCAAGAIGRHLAGVPDAGAWSFARVFADSLADLFDKVDAPATRAARR